jgi:hypothetical protein
MSREIRRAPPDWKHPTRRGPDAYYPLYDKFYGDALKQWEDDKQLWLDGTHPDYKGNETYSWEEWNGEKPNPLYYRSRKWDKKEATAYQVYETVSEGTPISPVFLTKEDLLYWLQHNGSGLGIGGSQLQLSRERAERFVERGSSVSMSCDSNRDTKSGLEI